MQNEIGFRWKLWDNATKLPWVCPANAYSKIVGGDSDQPLMIEAACLDRTGKNCWCGKVGALKEKIDAKESNP